MLEIYNVFVCVITIINNLITCWICGDCWVHATLLTGASAVISHVCSFCASPLRACALCASPPCACVSAFPFSGLCPLHFPSLHLCPPCFSSSFLSPLYFFSLCLCLCVPSSCLCPLCSVPTSCFFSLRNPCWCPFSLRCPTLAYSLFFTQHLHCSLCVISLCICSHSCHHFSCLSLLRVCDPCITPTHTCNQHWFEVESLVCGKTK